MASAGQLLLMVTIAIYIIMVVTNKFIWVYTQEVMYPYCLHCVSGLFDFLEKKTTLLSQMSIVAIYM